MSTTPSSDDHRIAYVDHDPLIPTHLGTNAPHVHVRTTDRCLRNEGRAPCLTSAELRERVAALEAEVERLTMTDESQRSALTLVLTEHRVWVEMLEDAIDQAAAIEPHGSDEWVTSGESMRATVLRVIRDAVARVDAPTIEARAREVEAEVERLRDVAAYSASQCEALAGRLRLAWDRLDAVRALLICKCGCGGPASAVQTPDLRAALDSDVTASEPTVERITDDNGDELERGADTDAEADQPQPTNEAVEATYEVAARFQDGEVFTPEQMARGLGVFDNEAPVLVARKVGDDEWLTLGSGGDFIAEYEVWDHDDEPDPARQQGVDRTDTSTGGA